MSDTVAGAVAGAVEARRRWDLLGRMRGAGRRLAGRPPRGEADAAPGAPGIARVMFDAFNITQDRISRAHLERDPPDVSVNPKLAAMGQFEFHRAAEAIALGHQAARAALPRIRAALEGAAART